MAVVLSNTFETGLASGTTITTGNSDDNGAGDPVSSVVINTGGAATFESASGRMGGLGLRIDGGATAASTVYVVWQDTVDNARLQVGCWWKFGAAPGTTHQGPLASKTSSGSGTNLPRLQLRTDRGLELHDGASIVDTSVALTAGAWYYLICDWSGTNGDTLTTTIYGADGSVVDTISATKASATALIRAIRVGKTSSVADMIHDFDDVRLDFGGTTPWAYPTVVIDDSVGVTDDGADLAVDFDTTPTEGLRVRVDWDRDGDFTDTFDDVTDDVRGGIAGSVEVQYGRDGALALTPLATGRGQLVLSNDHKRYTPWNSASELAGKIRPARPVQVTRVIDGVEYTLFAGHGDDQPLTPDLDAQSVTMTLIDYLADFRGVRVSTGVSQSIQTGAAIGLVLDAVGWTGGRDLDPGVTVIPYWWEEGTEAYEALERLVRSEGPPALLTVDGSGGIVFRDRHHRMVRTASSTSQATLRGSGPVEPVIGKGMRVEESWRQIVNDATVSVDVRRPSAARQVVWQHESAVTVPEGGSVTFAMEFDDPVIGLLAPVADSSLSTGIHTPGTDGSYLANTAQPMSRFDVAPAGNVYNVTLSRTSGQSAILTITDLGPETEDHTITNLQVVGTPVVVEGVEKVSASDSTSIADYGSRGLPFSDLGWAGVYDAQRIIDQIVAQRAQPLTQVTCRIPVGRTAAGTAGRSNARAAAILARDLSDRVTVVADPASIDGAFFVESIGHRLTGDLDHEVTLLLEEVPPDVDPTLANLFTFDNSTSGRRFDSGRFG